MFLFQRLLSSTKPIPNSFEAISSACPRSCEISSVIMERLKRLFGAEKKEACPFPYEASEIAAAPPRWVRNLRRDGDSGTRLSPVGRIETIFGWYHYCQGLRPVKSPKPRSAWENPFLPRFAGPSPSNGRGGKGDNCLLTLDFAFIDLAFSRLLA